MRPAEHAGESVLAGLRYEKAVGKRADMGEPERDRQGKERRKMAGKVWLVGAGPSEAELLTVKAKKVIGQADVVVYDALIGQSVVDIIPDAAEKIYVGKRAGHHSMPQEEINGLLLSLAKQDRKVVRLKGGDPFLFGRGGEELELLAKNRIPYEVVPGVTSALAVPAYFGIPVTHRELASAVHIVTGHRKEGELLSVNFRALREAGGTIVFLMGVSSLHNIASGLLEAGMEPETPAAILQQGACGRQKGISGTLATLEEAAKRQEISTPAVIVVGEVVRLGEKFSWYEKLPLFGKRYLVTRPRERSGELADRLRMLGAEVTERPMIVTQGIHPNEALRRELAHLGDYRFLVFTSPTGVTVFMEELFAMGRDARLLSGVSVAAIGPATARELKRCGIAADLVPEIYSGRALGILLAEHCDRGDRVLLARSDIGNEELVTVLQERKEVMATDIPVYITTISAESDGPFEDAGTADMDAVFFTSASTVRGFVSTFPDTDFSKVRAYCIGEMTAAEAGKYGMQVWTAGQASVEGLVELALKEAGRT